MQVNFNALLAALLLITIVLNYIYYWNNSLVYLLAIIEQQPMPYHIEIEPDDNQRPNDTTLQKRLFLTFADDSSSFYVESAYRLSREATQTGGFNKSIIYHWNNLTETFLEENTEILSHPYGHGLWLWKSKIILDVLTIKRNIYNVYWNDTICYADSKYGFIGTFQPIFNKLDEIVMSNSSLIAILAFANKPNEPIWNFATWDKQFNFARIKELKLDKLSMDIYKVDDVWGGLLCMKVTETVINIIQQWFELCRIKRFIEPHPNDQWLLTATLINQTYFDKEININPLPPSTFGPLSNDRVLIYDPSYQEWKGVKEEWRGFHWNASDNVWTKYGKFQS